MCIFHLGVHHMCAKVGLARLSGNLKMFSFSGPHIYNRTPATRSTGGWRSTCNKGICKIVKLMGESKTKVKFYGGKGKNIHNRRNKGTQQVGRLLEQQRGRARLKKGLNTSNMDDTKRSWDEVVVQERPAGDLQKVRRSENM